MSVACLDAPGFYYLSWNAFFIYNGKETGQE